MQQIFIMQDHMVARHVVTGCKHFWFHGSKPKAINAIALPLGTQDGNVLASRKISAEDFEAGIAKGDMKALGLSDNIFAMALEPNEDGTYKVTAKFEPGGSEEPKPKKKPSKKASRGASTNAMAEGEDSE